MWNHTLSALIFVVCITAPAGAVTLKVPGDHPTIQAAVDAAGAGDVIEIKGTYPEAVVIDSKTDLHLKAKGKAVVDGEFARTPMRVEGSSGITLEKIRFVRSSGDGLQIVDSTDVHVLKCRFEDHPADGIDTQGGSGIVVERCKFEDINFDGITFSDDETNPTVDSSALRNKFKFINGDGIEVHGMRVLLDANKITFTNDDGIDFDGDENVATGNKLSKIGDEGFEVQGDRNRVEGNKIGKIGEDGIDVEGSDNEILDNKIVRVLDDGIEVEPGIDPNDPAPATGNLVEGNKIKRADGNGVYMVSGSNTVRDNRTKKSGDFGLYDESQTGTNVYESNSFDSELIE